MIYDPKHPIITLPEVTVTGIKPMPELSEEGLLFVNSLNDNRNMLMRKFNLSDLEYADYAKLAINLASKESNFGSGFNALSYNVRRNMTDGQIQLAKKILRDKSSAISRGLTQIKYADDIQKSPKLKADYDSLGVTEMGIKTNPSVAALATIARIHHNDALVLGTKRWSDNTDIPWDVRHAIFWNRGKLTDKLNPNPAGRVDSDSASGYAKRYLKQKVKQ